MSRGKEGIVGVNSIFAFVGGRFSCSSNKSQKVLDSLHSSNKPGFIDVINRGIDENGLKGGLQKYEKTF